MLRLLHITHRLVAECHGCASHMFDSYQQVLKLLTQYQYPTDAAIVAT